MLPVLQGIGVLAAVVALGYLLARFRVLPPETPELLARLVFFVATPALLVRTLAEAPVEAVLSTNLALTACATTVAGGLYLLVVRLLWRRPLGESVIGALTSCYVNAGNLGIPLAVYVFGSAAFVAPVMLYQLLVLAPISFVVLDIAVSGKRPSIGRALAQPLRQPLVLGSALGIALALGGWELPELVDQPLAMVAGMAVPAALIAFGMALRGAPLPGRTGSRRELGLIVVLKLLVQPAAAYVVGRFVFGMDSVPLMAATLCAALPTAQNVFVYSLRYRTAVSLARDAVALTTLFSVPVLVAIVALLHA